MMDRLFAINSWASGTTDRGRHIRHRVNYPETAAICGREDCERPARLWLTELECADHQRGEEHGQRQHQYGQSRNPLGEEGPVHRSTEVIGRIVPPPNPLFPGLGRMSRGGHRGG